MKLPMKLSAVAALIAGSANAALLVHYDFNTSDATNSGSGVDGTVTGASSYVPSTAGSAAGLAWQGDRAVANSAGITTNLTGNDLGFGAGGVYTAMAWVNWAGSFEGGSVDHMVFGQNDGNTGGDAAQLHHGIRDDSSPLNIHFGGWGGAQDTSDAGAVPVGEWTHVAWQYDGADKVVYVNGVETSREAGNNITDPTLTVLVGAHTRGNTDANPLQSFNGLLDDVRIYDEALDSTGIMNAMDAVNVPEPSSLGLLGLAAFGLLRRRR